MSTTKERRAFLLTVGAKHLRDLAESNFHGLELPFWPAQNNDGVKLLNDAMRMASQFDAKAKTIAPDFDPETGSE